MIGETVQSEGTEYFPSRCGSCGRQGTVTREAAVGQLCEPCTKLWQQLGEMVFCNCPAMWGRHSLSCTLRIRDHAS